MTEPSPSSSASENDSSEWLSDSSASSSYSDDEAGDVFAPHEGDAECSSPHASARQDLERKTKASPPARRSAGVGFRSVENDRMPLRARGHHGRKSSFSGASDQSAQVYADELRTSRASFHRASISVGATTTNRYLSDDTRRRHRESKKRMEHADLTQELLFKASELDMFREEGSLWLHACVIPPRWRRQIEEHLHAIHDQMNFCRDRVTHAWHLLLPPFDRANMVEYENRLRLFEHSVANYEAAISQCEGYVNDGERECASVFLQLWYRRCLARRGFYIKTLRVTRQSRGLIPGLFDTIAETSRLTIHRATEETKLEYPRTFNAVKHAFLR